MLTPAKDKTVPGPLHQWWEKCRRSYQRLNLNSFGEADLSDDVLLVLQASSDLDIPEFALFVKAYEQWFGHAAEEPQVERYYLGYMFAGRVPHWVRDYCRQVVSSSRSHQLDPVRFGVLPNLTRRVRTGLTLLLLAFGLLAALITVAELTVGWQKRQISAAAQSEINPRP